MPEKGDKCFIVESNFKVSPITVISCSGNLYTVKFDSGGAIRLPGHRLFKTEEDAIASIRKQEQNFKRPLS